jgi:hypothetical protein
MRRSGLLLLLNMLFLLPNQAFYFFCLGMTLNSSIISPMEIDVVIKIVVISSLVLAVALYLLFYR